MSTLTLYVEPQHIKLFAEVLELSPLESWAVETFGPIALEAEGTGDANGVHVRVTGMFGAAKVSLYKRDLTLSTFELEIVKMLFPDGTLGLSATLD